MKIIENLINHTSWNYSDVTQNSEKHFQFTKKTNGATVVAIATTPAKKNPVLGHKYYGRCYQKSPLGFTCEDARFEYYVGDNIGVSNLVFGTMKDTKGEWERLSSIQQLTSTPTTGTWMTRNFVVNASNLCYRKELMIIDLTEAFGAGNEPSLEWCDEYLPYIEDQMVVGTTIDGHYPGEEIPFDFTGTSQEMMLSPGKYKLECWGAQGGSSAYLGGVGGYSKGTLTLSENTQIYCYVGGQGSCVSTAQGGGGFNGGGGNGQSTNYSDPGGGGGGTDIRIGQDSLYARVIVAGGGSGNDGGYYSNMGTSGNAYGYGGGEQGGPEANYNGSLSSYYAGQTSSGTVNFSNGGSGTTGSFGVGGNGTTNSSYKGSGGGGGWYGGVGSCYGGRGGGGSGYVYTSSSAGNYPSGCLLTDAYYLEDAATIAGNVSFLSPTGTTETGHSGNGYIKITVLEIESDGLSFEANNGIDTTFIPENISVFFDFKITNDIPTPPSANQQTLIIKKYAPFSTSFTNITTTKTTSYSFKEWNTNPNGSGTSYNPGDIVIISQNQKLTLYAIWDATDTYSGIDVGSPTYNGYDFLGWSANSFNDKNNLYTGSYIYLTGDTKALYPVFEPRKIRYAANGGNCPPVDTYLSGSNFTVSAINNMYHPFIIEKRAEITLINGLKREQIYNTTINTYTFSHWNTMPDGSGTTYNPGATISNPSSSLVLYAIWTKTSANNPVLLPTPTKTGFGFNGWGANSTAESGIKGLYDENVSKTLYATWNNQAEKVSYKPKIFQNDAWK